MSEFVNGVKFGLGFIVTVCLVISFFWLLPKLKRWNALAKIRRSEKDFSEVANHIEIHESSLTKYERWRLSETGEIRSHKTDIVFFTCSIIIGGVLYFLVSRFHFSNDILLFITWIGLFISLPSLIFSIRELIKYRRMLLFLFSLGVVLIYLWGIITRF